MALVQTMMDAATLAVVIGVIELVIGETFKIVGEWAYSWRRRWKLFITGRFHISTSPFVNSLHSHFITLALIVLVANVIALGLSIEDSTVRSLETSRSRCYGTRRAWRYTGFLGPHRVRLADPRLSSYLARANCRNTLFNNVLQGSEAMESGFPRCLPPMTKRGPVRFSAEIKGCIVGYVADIKNGNYHCDLIESGTRNESTLAGTTFITLNTESMKGNTNFFSFNDKTNRLIINVLLPKKLGKIKMNPNLTVSLECPKNDIACYDKSAEVLRAAPTVDESVPLPGRSVLVNAVPKRNASQICVLEDAQLLLKWANFSHRHNADIKKKRRKGPVLTYMSIAGTGRCARNMPTEAARVYRDGLASTYIGSPKKGEPEEANERELPELNLGDPITFLQALAVVTGMAGASVHSVDCSVHLAVNGSTMDLGRLIATAVISSLIVIATVFSLAYGHAISFKCPIRVDPLDPIWSVRHLLQADADAQSDDSDDDEGSGGSGHSERSAAQGSHDSLPLKNEQNGSDSDAVSIEQQKEERGSSSSSHGGDTSSPSMPVQQESGADEGGLLADPGVLHESSAGESHDSSIMASPLEPEQQQQASPEISSPQIDSPSSSSPQNSAPSLRKQGRKLSVQLPFVFDKAPDSEESSEASPRSLSRRQSRLLRRISLRSPIVVMSGSGAGGSGERDIGDSDDDVVVELAPSPQGGRGRYTGSLQSARSYTRNSP